MSAPPEPATSPAKAALPYDWWEDDPHTTARYDDRYWDAIYDQDEDS